MKHIEILNVQKNNILGFHRFRHPHVKEQPFTRTAIVLFNEPVEQVIIRAFDSVHEYGGKEIRVTVPINTTEMN